MENDRAVGKWFIENWERIFFASVGLVLLGLSLWLIFHEKITEGAAVFGIGFLCFIYANVARFKRIKGLGFEAELWEDKQKEAADLIERLRDVVSIYTREVVLGKVKAGRWGGGPRWSETWKLYNELIKQHAVLGQNIDFSETKKVMDDYFLFDMALRKIEKINSAISNAGTLAQQKINEEFGSPVRQTEQYHARFALRREIPGPIEEPFQIATQENLAQYALDRWDQSRTYVKQHFGINLTVDEGVLARLAQISEIHKSRPISVTDEMIEWASKYD